MYSSVNWECNVRVLGGWLSGNLGKREKKCNPNISEIIQQTCDQDVTYSAGLFMTLGGVGSAD